MLTHLQTHSTHCNHLIQCSQYSRERSNIQSGPNLVNQPERVIHDGRRCCCGGTYMPHSNKLERGRLGAPQMQLTRTGAPVSAPHQIPPNCLGKQLGTVPHTEDNACALEPYSEQITAIKIPSEAWKAKLKLIKTTSWRPIVQLHQLPGSAIHALTTMVNRQHAHEYTPTCISGISRQYPGDEAHAGYTLCALRPDST